MRLVAWNANHNVRKRSFDENLAILESFQPDLVVLSETAPPAAHRGDVHFVGGVPGLAVWARDGIALSQLSCGDSAPPLTAAFAVSGAVTFDLLACWPVSRNGAASYHEVLMATLELHGERLSSGRAIMAGDLNSSTRVVSQRRSHPLFVEAAAGLGLVSAYHALTGEPHGGEIMPTYRHISGANRDFHIDYCFVSESLLGASRLEVSCDRDWYSIGDHRPVVLDIDDEALRLPL
jgi:exodeoxyribonuclease-3